MYGSLWGLKWLVWWLPDCSKTDAENNAFYNGFKAYGDAISEDPHKAYKATNNERCRPPDRPQAALYKAFVSQAWPVASVPPMALP